MNRLSIIYFFVMVATLISAAAVAGGKEIKLPGGPEVVLQHYPESDVFCIAVSVEAGSALESPEMRGVTHLLEHLCFDGTERFSREQISSWVDERGAFLNAFTRKETTVYFLLAGREYLEEGIELLSQMLLHSVFPEDELAKERKVVLEEIGHSMDSPGQERSMFVDRYLYRGSALTEPVIGYPSTIESMSREAIAAYYRERYRPGRMKVLLMGGFEPGSAAGWMEDYFSSPGKSGEGHLSGGVPRWSREITRRTGEDMSAGLDLLVPVPGVGDGDFGAVLLLEELLQSGRNPFSGALAGAGLPDAGISLEVHAGFSALRFHIDAGSDGAEGLYAVPRMIESLADWRPSREDIEAARTSLIASEGLNREKYHFYIMMSGMRFGLFGGEYIEASTTGVREAGSRDVETLLSSCFEPLYFNAVLIAPPAEAQAEAEEAGPATRVLQNGCRLAAVTRTGSDIGAVHIVVRGRSCAEAGSIPGMTVLLNKVLEESGPGGALAEELRAMGASVRTSDNPYIPMDDYYLDRSFSFIRIEGPAASIIDATRLVVEHMRNCPITGEDAGRLQAVLAGELGVRGASGQSGLKKELLRRLFPGHPYSAPIFPGMRSLGTVTAGDLSEFRDRTISGSNLIATLVSPLKGDEGLDHLEEVFSALPAGETVLCPDIPGAVDTGDTDLESPGQGAYIGAAWRMTGPSPAEAAAASIAAEVLSRRMQLQIRETEGLAYSTGCSASLMPGAAVMIASVGTRAENLEKATEALKTEISRLATDPPSGGEIETARRRVLGRLSRRELSSINEAFTVGLDMLVRDGASLGRLIAGLPAAGVRDILSRVMTADGIVVVRMVPGAESGPKGPPGGMEKKSPPPGMMGR